MVRDELGVVSVCWRLRMYGTYLIEVAKLLALKTGLKIVKKARLGGRKLQM